MASTEQRELDLVEKVDFRILGVSNNEEKLQLLLKTYLPPLLLKAGSEHASVRNKVIAICHRLQTFIRPPGVILPVAALLDQYKAAESAIVKHFDIIFIQHSVDRLESPAERRALLPKAFRGIGSDRGAGVTSLFHIVLRLLRDLKIPSRGSAEDTALRKDFGLEDPVDAGFVAEWLGKLLLLRPSAPGAVTSPGLTEADVSFLTLGNKPETWRPAAAGLGLSLPEVRIKAVAFLASGAFTDEERFIPALYAAASSDFRISGVGDDMLKRTTVSLEDRGLVKKLFEAHGRLAAPYRIRILGLLSKSEVSTTFTDEILATFRANVVPPMMDEGSGSSAVQSTSGLELTKVHRALFEYINWVARIGPTKTDFSKIGPPLVKLLQTFVENQGWPKPEKGLSHDDVALRSRAYETIGVMAKGNTNTMSSNEKLSLAGWMFRSLAEDPTPDVVVNIDGALSSLTGIFKQPHNLHTQLRSILLSYMMMEEQQEGSDVVRSARHAAAKWANQCLPFSDVQARWIDILAIAGRRDERSDVVEEGQKGLDPWTYYANADDEKSRELPAWQGMVQAFFKEPVALRVINSDEWLHGRAGGGGGGGEMDVDERSVFVNFPSDAFLAFPVAVDYCRRILFLTALKGEELFKIEPGWERQLGTLVHSDLATRRTIRRYLASGQHAATYDLLEAAFEGMIKENSTVSVECARSFVDLASFAPAVVLKPLVDRARELLPLIISNKRDMRVLGARAYGILAAHPANSPETVANTKAGLADITKNLKTAIGSELNAVEGAFLALAHLVSRLKYYGSDAAGSDAVGDLGELFPKLDTISSGSLSTQESLFDAYSQLWTAGVQTVSTGGKSAPELKEVFVKSFIDPLVVQAKKGNEKAIIALGRLALSLPVATEGIDKTDDLLGLLLEKLYALYEIKQAEVHFAVGEAITAAIACWDAGVVQLTVDVETAESADTYRPVPKRPARITAVLEKLLLDCKNTKPSLLKASGIWLFCVIQHCSHLEEIQSRLRECQAAFMRLLGARDELVQETASRGLALVYEKGDPELKGELVRDLVSSFTGTGPKLKVDDETELFEAGALPTGEGKSITSYKDIVNLANEVGDQSLVYKFMSLATNAATWSTRSAFGRFGLSNILSESEIDPKLYPKLYRYRFDPNQNVQKSMNDIWKALVKDSNTVLETYFDAIIRDLLKSVLGKEWRVREASCAAISDLISGRPFQKYEPYYKDIWAAALKVLDDVKGTVRNAALRLCIALSTTLVRQLEESGSTASANAMMKEALPFLLSEKGIESGVDDVKMFATITVIKIAKTGGKSLNPYIGTTVPHLLGILSTIEPEQINYHYQRAGEDNREKIDRWRSAMVSQSPISEAIENLLRTVNKDVMADLAPRLEETVNTAVGMPTKIGCSRALSTLATRHSVDFTPYAARFLQLMEKQVLDRNDEVSQAYARAAAYIVRVTPDESKLKFASKLQKLYLNSEDELRRQKVADAVLALSKISPDHFNALEGQLLPFAYLAKHDTDDYVKKEFAEVWDKHAGSNLTVARYITEVVDLVNTALDSAQWPLKHAAALAAGSVVAAITANADLTGQANMDHVHKAWFVLERALLLRTFPNKGDLLEQFPPFVKKSRPWWEVDREFAAKIKQIAVREAKRNNATYRPSAFRNLWQIAELRDDLEMLSEIAVIVAPCMDMSDDDDEDNDADKMDVDSGNGSTANKVVRGLDPKSSVAWAAIEAITRGHNRLGMDRDPIRELMKIVLAFEENKPARPGTTNKDGELRPFIARPEFDIIRRIHWYSTAAEILEAAHNTEAVEEGAVGGVMEPLNWFLVTLDLDKADVGTEDQRLMRIRAVKAVLKMWIKYPRQVAAAAGGETNVNTATANNMKMAAKETVAPAKVAIEKALQDERSLDVRAKWRECLVLVDELLGLLERLSS